MGQQGTYQSNPFFKVSVAQAHVAAFFGYAEAYREMGSKLSDLKLAQKFIDKWALDVDSVSLSQRYVAYKLQMSALCKLLQNSI